LTVYTSGDIDGACIQFYYQNGSGLAPCGAGELRIAGNDVTITGEAASISGAPNAGSSGYCAQGPNPGLITTVGLADQVTFQSDGEQPLTVYGQIDVQAKLVNNARFGVGRAGGVMKLSGYPKAGNGEWFNEFVRSDPAQVGVLEVDVEVGGSATWRISDDPDAVIWIKADCTALTGDVEVSKGLLQIDANFCTTGELTVEGVNNHLGSDAGSRIWVAREKSASFGGSCQ